jgi:outer membrane protein OmpA-like peptidoglycan-associated protein
MKYARMFFTTLAVALSACSFNTPEGSQRGVSPDYVAVGDLDAAAIVYGRVTVVEFDKAPSNVVIRDDNGNPLPFERVGRHYRLSHVVPKFTVWANGHAAAFSAVTTTRVFPPRPETHQAAKIETNVAPEPADSANDDVAALLKLAEAQLAEARQLMDQSKKAPGNTSKELSEVTARLDLAETRLITAAAAIVRVSFPSSSTTFKPSIEVSKVLIESGKSAEQVNIHGRTDSKVAGDQDAKIALARALAARTFLVDNGVSADKIRVFSRADGDFVVPNSTKEGRALNRRVEFEFVNKRIGEQKSRSVADQ